MKLAFVVVLSIIVFILIIVFIWMSIEIAKKPKIQLSVIVNENASEDALFEQFGICYNEGVLIHASKEYQKELLKAQIWLNRINEEIVEKIPNGSYQIKVFASAEEDKVKMCYKGYLTDENGQKVPYCSENSFALLAGEPLFEETK